MLLRAIAALAILLFGLIPGIAAAAQVASAITVNGVGISDFDIDQRAKLLRVVGVTGNLRKQAEDALIDDRLYLQEARRMGIQVPEETIQAGLSEYAARRNQSADQFIRTLRSNGVAESTAREFIRAGLAWRILINSRFLDLASNISSDEIDQAVSGQGTRSRHEILLSEIVMSYRPATRNRMIDIANRIRDTVRSTGAFSEAARSLSEAESAANGGQVGWIPVGNFSGVVRDLIESTPVGTPVEPIVTDSNIYIFFKRDERSIVTRRGPTTEFDYATLRVYANSGANARQRAAGIVDRVESCNDLLAESRYHKKGSFFRQKTDASETLESLMGPLDMLDEGEATVLAGAGSSNLSVVVLMLCDRITVLDDETREAVVTTLRSRKLEDLAEDLLADLRATAIIKRR